MGLFRKNGLARLFKTPVIVPGKVFDVRSELAKIFALPRKKRSYTLKAFHKKYLYQKIGMALLHSHLLNLIRRNPDLSSEELCKEAKTYERNYGLTDTHKEFIKAAIYAYVVAHKAVANFREKYPIDQKLYRALFGREPVGRVRIFCGPMTLHFHCNNLEDYARIYHQIFKSDRKVTEDDKKLANLSGGVFISNAPIKDLIGSITAEKSDWFNLFERFSSFLLSSPIYDHEQQHAIYSLLSNLLDVGWEYEGRENQLKKELVALKKQFNGTKSEQARLVFSVLYYLQGAKINALEDAHDEILASLAGNSHTSYIFKKLIDLKEGGGLYDFLGRSYVNLEQEIDAWPSCLQSFAIMAMDFNRKEYEAILRVALQAANKIRKMGLNKEELVALLTWEPVISWQRLAQRIKNLAE